MSDESVIDPVTHKPRLLSEQCATCVFRPGNLMHLRPGRLKLLIEQNTGPAAHGLICHETLSYSANPGFGPAFCRGFYDQFGHLANYIRICERLGGFTEVDPPGKEPVMSIIKIEDTNRARAHVMTTYKYPEDRATHLLEIARELASSPVNRPTDEGFFTLTWNGKEFVFEDVHR